MEVRQYAVVLENAGADGWAAYVPDLPGCTAGGNSKEEALENVRTSAEQWIAHAKECGEPLPEPSTQATSLAIAV
jgi:predicted RNase H-like HicB family nuclease